MLNIPIKRIIPSNIGHCIQVMVVSLTMISTTRMAADSPRGTVSSRSKSNWYTGFEAGAGYQMRTDIQGGGEFGLSRFAMSGSLGYRTRRFDTAALSIGFQQRAYDFDGANLLTPSDPWDQVHFLSISLPMFKRLGEDWTLMAIPTIRTMVEDTEDFDQDMTGGGIVGLSYQINPKLKLGPGFGILSQLEDNTSVFPVVVIDWDISEKWNLQTGRGFGASQGPGLTLSYALNESWSLAMSGRFERFRFRMDQQGPQPGGIGEDRNASVYLAAMYRVNPQILFNVFTGLTFAGELSVDDASGNEIAERDYEATPVIGVNMRLRF